MHHVRHWLVRYRRMSVYRTSPSFKLFLSISQASIAATVVQAKSPIPGCCLNHNIVSDLFGCVYEMAVNSRTRKEKKMFGL